MNGKIKVMMTVSKKSCKLIKQGKAILTSGGVRDLTGRIIEMARPAVAAAESGELGMIALGLDVISGLGNNAQSAFIQRSVDKANVNIGILLNDTREIKEFGESLYKSVNRWGEKTNQALSILNDVQVQLDHAIEGVHIAIEGEEIIMKELGTLTSLGWVNCAVGLANCAISAAGFMAVLGKLDDIGVQLNDITTKIEDVKHTINYNYWCEAIQSFEQYKAFIKTDIDLLQNADFDNNRAIIEEHMNSIAAYLHKITIRFEANTDEKPYKDIASNIIITLSSAFAQEIREFSARYYYVYGGIPANYDMWVDVVGHIKSELFANTMKEYLIVDCLDVPESQKKLLYASAMNVAKYALSDLEYSKELVKVLDKESYLSLDEWISKGVQYIEDGDPELMDEIMRSA